MLGKKQFSSLLNPVISLTASTFTLVLLTAGMWDKAVKKSDCETCADLKKTVEFYRGEAKTSIDSLAKLKTDIKNLQPSEDAKRMKMASQVFYLTAKIETSENMVLVKEKDRTDACNKCAPPVPAKPTPISKTAKRKSH